jgi:hypothetical protein
MKLNALWISIIILATFFILFCSTKESWKPTNLKHFYRSKYDNLYDMPKSYGIIANSLECSNKVVLQIQGYIYYNYPKLYNSEKLPINILDSYEDLENRVYTFIFCDPNVNTIYMEVNEDYLPERVVDIQSKQKYSFEYPEWLGIENDSDDLSWTSTTDYCVRAKNGNYIFKLTRN